ncbi:hypothetical protein SCG7086_BR_00060 [Chlamydiales bacterium SCGC AG-110-P3]|nr:hypothetical protein SCG7086_BR_00060 [Chlamydiales bacterium SCGC AG-110-P3]
MSVPNNSLFSSLDQQAMNAVNGVATDRRDRQKAWFTGRYLRNIENLTSAAAEMIKGYHALVNDPCNASMDYCKSGKCYVMLAAYRELTTDQVARVCSAVANVLHTENIKIDDGEAVQETLQYHADKTPAKRLGFSPAWEVIDELPKLADASAEPMLARFLSLFQHGAFNLVAHGVEPAKGGFSMFLNIILQGVISKGEWGPLLPGNPMCHSGPHGPYYVVTDGKTVHHAYIVPTAEHLDAVRTAMSMAVDRGLISEEEGASIRKVVVSADEVMTLADSAFVSNTAFVDAVRALDSVPQ